MTKRKILEHRGMNVRNNFELKIAKDLVYKAAKGKRGKHKRPKISYETDSIEYVLYKKYIPDFKIEFTDTEVPPIFIEAKGYLRAEDRTKMRAIKKQNPLVDLRIVFMKDLPLYKGSKTTYSQWAEKLGIPWAIGTIPDSWLQKDITYGKQS